MAEYQGTTSSNTILQEKKIRERQFSSPNAKSGKSILCSLGDVLELSIDRRVVPQGRHGESGHVRGSSQSTEQSRILLGLDVYLRGSFNSSPGRARFADSEMVVILPSGDPLPEPDLDHEIVPLLIEECRVLGLDDDFFRDRYGLGCLLFGELFTTSSDRNSNSFECGAHPKVALGLLARAKGLSFRHRPRIFAFRVAFVGPRESQNPVKPLKLDVLALDEVLVQSGSAIVVVKLSP